MLSCTFGYSPNVVIYSGKSLGWDAPEYSNEYYESEGPEEQQFKNGWGQNSKHIRH